MPIVLGTIAGIERRSNIPYIEVYLMVISNSGYYIYAIKPSWIPVPGCCLRVYIWIGGSLGPLKKGCKEHSKVPL